MTENEILILKDKMKSNMNVHFYDDVMKVFDEVLAYRAIGTVEHIKLTFELCKGLDAMVKMYEAIGTIDEFKDLKEKMQDVEIAIIDRMQEFYDEYRSISQSSVDHFGGKADAIETSQKIVKGVFKDLLGLDWRE